MVIPFRHGLVAGVVVVGLITLFLLRGAGDRTAVAAPLGQPDVEAGHQVYVENCAICHGDEGDGAGPAAELLRPRPRDFREGIYKIRTTASGEPATREDLFRVISEGMPGTSMPGWRDELSERERRQVATYIQALDRFYDPEYEPEIVSPGPKVDMSAESIAQGEQLYQELECWKCHGDAGRGNGPSAFELEDDWGFPILPADLTQNWTFKGGGTVDDIYMRFSTGMNGTPMPAFGSDVINNEERWHLANYVRSLSPEQRPRVRAVVEAVRIDGELPNAPDDAAWEQARRYYYPLAGQIVMEPRLYTPSIRSVFVQALYNDDEFALRVTWNDRTENLGDDGPPDAVAVQFPSVLPEGQEKPYFILGDPDHPVNLWRWSAAGQDVEELTATGVGTESPQSDQSLAGSARFDDGQWQVVLRRSLNTDDSADIQFERETFIPVAFMVWNGYFGESGGEMSISSWYSLYLKEPTSARTYAWVPIAMLATVLVEWGIFRMARRRSRDEAEDAE